jgi:hypothetical protein
LAKNIEACVCRQAQIAAVTVRRPASLEHPASGLGLTVQQLSIGVRSMRGLPILNFSV